MFIMSLPSLIFLGWVTRAAASPALAGIISHFVRPNYTPQKSSLSALFEDVEGELRGHDSTAAPPSAVFAKKNYPPRSTLPLSRGAALPSTREESPALRPASKRRPSFLADSSPLSPTSTEVESDTRFSPINAAEQSPLFSSPGKLVTHLDELDGDGEGELQLSGDDHSFSAKKIADLSPRRPPVTTTKDVLDRAPLDVDLSNTDAIFRRRNAHRIACPVLAAAYRRGWLDPDARGRVSRDGLYRALRNAGSTRFHAEYMAVHYAAFLKKDETQTQGRYRAWGRQRFLDIFRMNRDDFKDSELVQYGFSSTVRDTGMDEDETRQAVLENVSSRGAFSKVSSVVIEQDLWDVEESLAIRALREKRFEQIFRVDNGVFVNVFGENRMYARNLANLLAILQKHGDFSGEWSMVNTERRHPLVWRDYGGGAGGRSPELFSQWQAVSSFVSLLNAFGREQLLASGGSTGDDDADVIYLTEADLKKLYLDSEFPSVEGNVGNPAPVPVEEDGDHVVGSPVLFPTGGLREWGFTRSEMQLLKRVGLAKPVELTWAARLGADIVDAIWFWETPLAIGMRWVRAMWALGFFADDGFFVPI